MRDLSWDGWRDVRSRGGVTVWGRLLTEWHMDRYEEEITLLLRGITGDGRATWPLFKINRQHSYQKPKYFKSLVHFLGAGLIWDFWYFFFNLIQFHEPTFSLYPTNLQVYSWSNKNKKNLKVYVRVHKYFLLVSIFIFFSRILTVTNKIFTARYWLHGPIYPAPLLLVYYNMVYGAK